MNLLFLTNSLAGGGAERVVATLANFWAGRGWKITVVTLAPAGEDFYPLHPQVRRIALHLADPSANSVDALRHNVRRILALRRVLREVRPTVAVAMMSTSNVLLACARTGIAGIRAIGSERCYPPHAPLGRVWNALCSVMYGRLSAVVALTQESAEWIRTHSSARRVPVIPNAAAWPLADYPPVTAPQAVVAPGRKMLLAVGRLDAVKNYALLIGAFARLADQYPDWDLVILGEGPERPVLAAQVLEKKIDTRVFLPGIAGNVGAWYRHADLFAMTSRSEGFPNALVEALAHGLPAVSVDCDTGPRDIIRDGIDGLLVTPDDAAALVDALAHLMGNATRRMRFAARAQEARERFSLDKIAGMWEALFHDVVQVPVLQSARRGSHLKRCGS